MFRYSDLEVGAVRRRDEKEMRMQQEPVTRTEIADHIEGVFGDHAIARGDLIAYARAHGARPELIKVLDDLPSDRPYSVMRDLWTHLEDVPV
jgi:hypothetical protein